MQSELHDLPPAFVITAECDPLRDEGELYAEKLKQAGVEVFVKRNPGMIHGFTTFSDLFGDESIEDIRFVLQKLCASR